MLNKISESRKRHFKNLPYSWPKHCTPKTKFVEEILAKRRALTKVSHPKSVFTNTLEVLFLNDGLQAHHKMFPNLFVLRLYLKRILSMFLKVP